MNDESGGTIVCEAVMEAEGRNYASGPPSLRINDAGSVIPVDVGF